MDEQQFGNILTALRFSDNPVEAQAARILIETGEALARGNTSPFDLALNGIKTMSDGTAAKVSLLILAGVLYQVRTTTNQADKIAAHAEIFERGWKRGFDKGFLEALKISRS